MISTIDELLEAVKPRLADYLSLHDIDPSKKFKCICHDDHNPSMSLHQSGLFAKCFSCNKVITIFNAASILEQKPIDGPEFITDNVMYLADKFGIKYNIVKGDNAKSALKYSYLRAYKVVADYIQQVASENPTDAFDRELRRRKWKKKESIENGLGCVHSFKDVLDVLIENDFSKEFIEISGLLRPDLFNVDGVIFTIYDEFGRPIAFYMRDTRYEEKKTAYEASLDKLEVSRTKCPMKYNSTANYTGIYEKSLYPYGINDVRNCHKVIAVEGHGCKHNLKLNDIYNAIALGGLELNDQTLHKLYSLGVTNVVLFLDNDQKGIEKTKNIIRTYYGKCPIDFSVLDMSAYSEAKDPDEFIRKYGNETFNLLKEQSALEWLTTRELTEKGDPYTVLQDIVPLIAMEKSPITRLKIVNLISEMTAIDRAIIQEEVDQKISSSKDRKSEFALKVLDEVKELLIMNPGAIDAALNVMEQKLGALNKDGSDEQLFSATECLKSLVKLQDTEENEETTPIIRFGFTDWDRYCPMPTNEAFVLVVSPPNSGKTALFISTIVNVLENNPNAMIIVHTIDDSRDVYTSRIIAVLTRIKMNWIKRPKHYLNEDLAKRRHEAYQKVSEWVRDERLVIKDITHGNTVEFHGRLCQYYRDRHPTRHIVAMCDNLHRLDTEGNYEDGRFKYKAISALMKSYTTKYDLVSMCTVEMTKQGMYEKPTNASSIAEAASLQFDANLIIYLYNEINILREDAKLTFESTISEYNPEYGYIHKQVTKPIIEALFLKNKLSEFKGSIFFKFHSEMSLYEEQSIKDVQDMLESKGA